MYAHLLNIAGQQKRSCYCLSPGSPIYTTQYTSPSWKHKAVSILFSWAKRSFSYKCNLTLYTHVVHKRVVVWVCVEDRGGAKSLRRCYTASPSLKMRRRDNSALQSFFFSWDILWRSHDSCLKHCFLLISPTCMVCVYWYIHWHQRKKGDFCWNFSLWDGKIGAKEGGNFEAWANNQNRDTFLLSYYKVYIATNCSTLVNFLGVVTLGAANGIFLKLFLGTSRFWCVCVEPIEHARKKLPFL